MNGAKLQLSAEEMALVCDPGWILTKNSVITKVIGLMGELAGVYQGVFRGAGIAGIEPGNPKVSRGENYRGLPWVMLDYPRVFGREDVVAIRTFFWWGHSFSITLHLKGVYQRLYLPVIRSRWAELAAAGFYVGVSDDEWRHEHTPEVFRPMDGVFAGAGAALGDGGLAHAALSGAAFGTGEFFKLSAAVGLDRWGEATEYLLGAYRTLVGVLQG